MEVSGQIQSLAYRFNARERAGTHWIGGWVRSTASLEENISCLAANRTQFLCSPASGIATISTELPRHQGKYKTENEVAKLKGLREIWSHKDFGKQLKLPLCLA
jgi:hypothetical protein